MESAMLLIVFAIHLPQCQMAPSMVIIPLTKYNAKAPTPAITNIRAYNPKNITINSILILSLVQIYEKYPKVANF